MEWLMGKARGVSRGLMNTSATSSAPATFSHHCISESPTNEDAPLLFLKPHFLRQQLPLVTGSLCNPTDFPALVEPLPSLEVNEWIAVHTIGLFENVSTLYDSIYELCVCRVYTPEHSDFGLESDQSPSIAPRQQQQQNSHGKKTARQVINLALSECNDLIQSSRIFPIKQGQPFPSDLRKEATRICQKLFLFLAHIYAAHLQHLEQLELIAHANTLAKHFFAFTTHFELMRDADFGFLNGFHRLLLATPAPTPQSASYPPLPPPPVLPSNPSPQQAAEIDQPPALSNAETSIVAR